MKSTRAVPDQTGKHPVVVNTHQGSVEVGVGPGRTMLGLHQARLLAYAILSAVEEAQEPERGN